jgi:hypothetical protein
MNENALQQQRKEEKIFVAPRKIKKCNTKITLVEPGIECMASEREANKVNICAPKTTTMVC